MTEFRFRAAAALDLRRKQENTAATALAAAEAAFRAAEAHAAQADAHRRAAQAQEIAVQRAGAGAAELAWHRNWIVRLENDLVERRRQVDTLSQAVREAEAQWRKARQRRLTLDRMRDRAWRRFQQDQHRRELKVIDELARLRYVMPDAWRDDS